MIRNLEFWVTNFKKLNGHGSGEKWETGDMLALDAASFLLSKLFQSDRKFMLRRSADKLLAFPLETEPTFPKAPLEKMLLDFASEGLTPTGLDYVAVIYETSGGIIRNGATIEGIAPEYRQQVPEYRLLYPAASASFAINNDTNTVLADQIKKGLEEILNAAESHQLIMQSKALDFIKAAEEEANNRIIKSAESVVDKIEHEGKSMLESKKNELVENLILQDVMSLWDSKARSHKLWFYIGGALFVALIAGPIALGVNNFPQLAATVQSVLPTGTSVPWGSLVIFTIPALGYAWILRLVSRFTLQNLTLADDAAQRSVMAKTFVRLVAEDKADDEKDRAIMLNALFRPIPGAKEQDLQPPSIADFVSKQS